METERERESNIGIARALCTVHCTSETPSHSDASALIAVHCAASLSVLRARSVAIRFGLGVAVVLGDAVGSKPLIWETPWDRSQRETVRAKATARPIRRGLCAIEIR